MFAARRLSRFATPVVTGRMVARSTTSIRAFSQYKYLPSHEYVKFDEGNEVVTIGISDYAQSQLGDVVYVELPSPGDSFEKEAAIAAVESVKAASDVFTPVSGIVTEVNEELVNAPEKVNTHAMTDAWFVKLKMSEPSELENGNLLDEAAYKKLCEEEEENH